MWKPTEFERLAVLAENARTLLTADERATLDLADRAFERAAVPDTPADESAFIEPYWPSIKAAAAEGIAFEVIADGFPKVASASRIDDELQRLRDRVDELVALREQFRDHEATLAMEASMDDPGRYVTPDDVLIEAGSWNAMSQSERDDLRRHAMDEPAPAQQHADDEFPYEVAPVEQPKPTSKPRRPRTKT